jgi:20S proteasome alpha/beta subunit
VTLIAAFRCTDGAIICADSQETIGTHHRVSVQKIAPFEVGDKIQIVIAGSAENAELADAFIETLREELQDKNITTLKEFKREAQRCLAQFVRDEASLWPRNERWMRFIVAARIAEQPPRSGESVNVHGLGVAQVWETKSTRLVAVEKYALVGCEEHLYRRAVDRLFRAPLPISRAIPLAMHLFSLAEDTSNYVRGPISVAVVTNTSPILIENPDAIQEFEAMTEVYTGALEDMLLSCADTALSKEEFADKFATFTENVFRLRQAYFKAVSDREAYGFFSGRWPGVPYRRLSKWTIRTMMADGHIETTEDREQVERHRKQVRELIEFTEQFEAKLSDAHKSEPKP